MSKIYTCRFILKDGYDYKDLAPIFPDVIRYILEENGHFQTEEEADMNEMFVEINMQDIRANRKPEGYNRKAKFRLMFPEDTKEFYIKEYANNGKEIKRVGTKIDEFLASADIGYEMKYDYTVGCIPGSEGMFSLSDNTSEIQFPATYEFGSVLRANIKIKKMKKSQRFGYMTNGVFHPLTLTKEDRKGLELHMEIVDDMYFGFQ